MESNRVVLSPRRVESLKSLIHSHLQATNVYSQVRDFMKDVLSHEVEKAPESRALDRATSGTSPEEETIRSLREKGVIDEIIKSLNANVDVSTASRAVNIPKDVQLSSGRRYMHFKLFKGKAFVEYITTTAPTNSNFVLHIHFDQQRFQSKPVPCAVEPTFDESFIFDLQPSSTNSMVETPTLLKNRSPLHLCLVKVDPDGTSTVVALHSLEWRKVLVRGSLSFTIELSGVGAKSKLPLGLLSVHLDLLPKPELLLAERDFTEKLAVEKRDETEKTRVFFEYANEWWRDYKQIRASHERRVVKIYAETEDRSYKPVCWFLCPLRAGRLLDSPFHAARFVSLIPFEREHETPGTTKVEVWHSMHTFLTKGTGDCEEHALLLCSLLLGFGLDAYVCIGASGDDAHVWVMTRTLRGTVIFWESLTGQRLAQDDPRVSKYYKRIGCVFNHFQFFANNQPDDTVIYTQFDLENEANWKPMAEEFLDIGGTVPLPLTPSTIACHSEEEHLETILKQQINGHRSSMDYSTTWDEDLSYLLTPALSNYELDRLGGITFGNEEFQQSVKRSVPSGHTFKGFPIQFSHAYLRQPARIMTALCKSEVCADILRTRGDHVRFGLRVKIFAYPEDVCAIWVMLAVRYRSV